MLGRRVGVMNWDIESWREERRQNRRLVPSCAIRARKRGHLVLFFFLFELLNLPGYPVSHENYPGLGLASLILYKGTKFKVIMGSRCLLWINNIYITPELADRPESSLLVGNVYIAINNSFTSQLGYTDTIVKGASYLIYILYSRGFSTFIIIEDTKLTITAITESISILALNIYSSLLLYKKVE